MDHDPHSPSQPTRPRRSRAERVQPAGPAPVLIRPSQIERIQPVPRFEPPLAAIGPMFRHRLQRVHLCRVPYELEINPRPTNRVLGGYYKSRRLVRIYAHDTEEGRRPLEELFDTFLHEIAHHLEYTEPQAFSGRRCGRVPGRMHSKLFWKILSDLKQRWARLNDPTL